MSGHFDVPLIAPVGTPGIFDQPIILALFRSIPHNQNRMVSGFGALDISIDTHTLNLVSVRLWNFKDGESLEERFLAKNQYSQRYSFCFVNMYYNELQFFEKCPNHTFKVDFLCQKSIQGDH